ncbi:MAG: deoxyribose-phosphate aldolase [Crocinitomicaceae bacterium]|nr:deoxyribose-phosphate aldolase [Crocinitomicaceae bacterium]|tara:strand:- start:1354 stop:2211 length:858 start_codon:yes stop_codon:yes gene_type:complete
MLNTESFSEQFEFNSSDFDAFVSSVEAGEKANTAKRAKKLISVVDLTSLNATDTFRSVKKVVNKAIDLSNEDLKVGGVCLFPNYVKEFHKLLLQQDIPMACVAGAFPLGQADRKVKLVEVERAIYHGANEIDYVINRGLFLNNEYEELINEVRAARQLCEGKAELKVIIENSDLDTLENIYLVSRLTLAAGAHFIKTSTGKGAYGAKPKHAWVMLQAIKDHYNSTGVLAGLKVAGGIRTPEEANLYYEMARHFFGKSYAKPHLFRIGASSLLDNLVTVAKSTGVE